MRARRMATEKRCKDCGQVYPLTGFHCYKKSGSTAGYCYTARCKECHNAWTHAEKEDMSEQAVELRRRQGVAIAYILGRNHLSKEKVKEVTASWVIKTTDVPAKN